MNRSSYVKIIASIALAAACALIYAADPPPLPTSGPTTEAATIGHVQDIQNIGPRAPDTSSRTDVIIGQITGNLIDITITNWFARTHKTGEMPVTFMNETHKVTIYSQEGRIFKGAAVVYNFQGKPYEQSVGDLRAVAVLYRYFHMNGTNMVFMTNVYSSPL